jgi:hypothetical protein
MSEYLTLHLDQGEGHKMCCISLGARGSRSVIRSIAALVFIVRHFGICTNRDLETQALCALRGAATPRCSQFS